MHERRRMHGGREGDTAKQSRESTLTFTGLLSGTNTPTHRCLAVAPAFALLLFLSVSDVAASLPTFFTFLVLFLCAYDIFVPLCFIRILSMHDKYAFIFPILF